MQTKTIIRIIFIAILLIAITCGGIYAFFKLKTNETLYHTDLFSLVPTDSEILMYIKNPEELPADFSDDLFPEQSCLEISRSLCKIYDNDINISGNNELILSFQGDEGIVFYRMPGDQVKKWEKHHLQTTQFLFAPQKKTYKNIPISIYLTSNDRFFCFAHHQGAFIGSYSIHLLYKALDMYDARENLRDNPSFVASLKTSGMNAQVSCFFKNKEWSSFDMLSDDGILWISGCLLPEYTSPELYHILNMPYGKEPLDPENIPATASAVVYLNADTCDFYNQSQFPLLLQDSIVSENAYGDVTVVYFSEQDSVCHHYKVTSVSIKDENLMLPSSTHLSKYQENDHIQKDSVEVYTIYNQNILVGDSKKALHAYVQALKSEDTFLKSHLYQLYNKHKNEDAILSILLDGATAFSDNRLCNEIIPDYFIRKSEKSNKYQLFLQFNREEGLVYYMGTVREITN